MTDERPVVLAVDDTPANLDLLREILRENFRVKVATRGDKALALAAKTPQPDIILLDIMMPGMDGYEVCRRLKARPEIADTPVVFITAKTQAEDEQLGLDLGAVDYITKPFNSDVVLARVNRHLAGRRRTRALEEENASLRLARGSGFTELNAATLESMLAAGEGDRVEFKSTLRWNLHADRTDRDIENSNLKTVAGYLNTDGGTLFIGVDDRGTPLGLDRDGFRNEDKLMLHWTNLLSSYLGAEFVRYLRSTICDVGEQRVLVVEVLPSAAPVFFARDNSEAFYVRVANSTQALSPSKTLAYIHDRFDSGAQSEGAASVAPKAVPERQQDLHSLADWLRELQDRHVFRTGILYLILGWAFTEMSTTVVSTLDAPEWVERLIVVAFVGGFPVVVVLAWLYDLRIHRALDRRAHPRRRNWWLLSGALVLGLVTAGLYALFS